MKNVCHYCHQEFDITVHQKTKKYCSNTCYDTASYKRRGLNKNPKLGRPKKVA
jgi:hypothetical protein